MRKGGKGFTLAELLIVVAIIAVLVAIAIPVFTLQREKAAEGVDLATVRNMYSEAMQQFVIGESDGEETEGHISNGYGWAYQVPEDGEDPYLVFYFQTKQGQEGWQTAGDIVIGGYTINKSRCNISPDHEAVLWNIFFDRVTNRITDMTAFQDDEIDAFYNGYIKGH